MFFNNFIGNFHRFSPTRRPRQNEEDHGHDDDGGRDEGHDGHTVGPRPAVPDGRQGDDHQQDRARPVADHHAQEAVDQVRRARGPRDAHGVGRVAVGGRSDRRRMGQAVVVRRRRSAVGVREPLQAVNRHTYDVLRRVLFLIIY